MRANLLIDSLPETITVEGREYSINADFRTGILFELLTYDESVRDDVKCRQIFDLFFGGVSDVTPPYKKEAFDAILSFYRCEREENRVAKSIARRNKQMQSRIYDFDVDDAHIYAAFFAQYGIDLNDVEYLHWWKFKALFDALDDDQKIVKIMGYRAADLSKIKNQKERERMARLKALYALPNAASREEKVAHAASIFAGGIGE